MTTSDRDPLEYLRSLDLSEYRADDALELAQRSIAASGGVDPTRVRTEAVLRLSGPGVVDNEVPIREAGRILETFQDAFSCFGQQIISGEPVRRPPTARAKRQTELTLRPMVTPGSVQLHLDAPAADQESSLPGVIQTIADRAVDRLVTLLNELNSEDVNQEELVGELRSLGPETARRLNALARELVGAEVDVDITWRKFAMRPQKASLRLGNAQVLQAVIKANRIDVQEVVLIGRLVTVSNVQKCAVIMDDGSIVSLDVDPTLAATAARFFDKRVVVEADETITHQDVTDRERSSYVARSITPEPGPGGAEATRS